MKAFTALIKREYLEHRGAFVIAPLALLGLLAAAVALSAFGGRARFDIEHEIGNIGKLFELAFGAMTLGWWLYLLVALFFYFADAFAADRRNNAMLFWKSMPQSDLKILWSKFGAGMTIFPGLIFLAVLATGLLAYVATLLMAWKFPELVPVDFIAAIRAYGAVALAGVAYFVIGLAWYAPFFAWVGALSSVVGRWSMPLAFLIPGVAIGLENLLRLWPGPDGGYLWAYLSRRAEYGMDRGMGMSLALDKAPLDPIAFIADLLLHVDWTMMLSGWAFTMAAIYAASQYRRRTVDN